MHPAIASQVDGKLNQGDQGAHMSGGQKWATLSGKGASLDLATNGIIWKWKIFESDS